MDDQQTPRSVQRLDTAQRALLQKFYRHHVSKMRITQQAEAWVIREQSIIAGLCLATVAEGYWLTGLFTAPSFRQQGAALQLINHIQAVYPDAPIWLFWHPDLHDFYTRAGFKQTQQLPEALKSRLDRYQQHKTLIAMHAIKS